MRVILTIGLLAAVGGCGGYETSPTETADEDSAAAASSGTGDLPGPEQREGYIKKNLSTVLQDTMGDDWQGDWTVRGFEHRQHLTFVELGLKAKDSEFRFKSIVSFVKASKPEAIGAYQFFDRSGKWELLFYGEGVEPDDELMPMTLPASDR